jgi:chromosome segregation ATPase
LQVSAKPYRVEKKRGIMITMVDGGKNFYEAVEADEIALAVMIKQHELEVAKQALKRAQTKKHTGLTDSDESSQSESDSDTSSAGSEENNDSSDDEHHADTDNGDVVTALQRQLESSRDKLVNAEARVLELERSRRALQKATFDLEMKVDEAEAKLDDAVKKQEVAAVEMATEKQRREHCEAQLGERTKEIKELRKQIAAAVSPALDNDGQGLLQAEREKRTECEQEARQLSRRLKDVEEQLAAVTEQHSQQAESLTAQRSASMGHGSAVVEMKMARAEQADRIAQLEAQLEAQREELKQTPAANTNGSAKCSQPTKMAKAGGLAGHMPYVPHGARRQRRASEVAVRSTPHPSSQLIFAKISVRSTPPRPQPWPAQMSTCRLHMDR